MRDNAISLEQFIISILTIAMSGVVAAWMTNSLGTRRDKKRFRRQRIEEAYIAFKGFSNLLGQHWLRRTNVMLGKLTLDQVLDMEIAAGKDESRSFAKLEMLVTLYCPELAKFFGQLITIRDEGNKVLFEHQTRYKAGNTIDKESFDRVGVLVEALARVEADFASAAREAVQPLLSAG